MSLFFPQLQHMTAGQVQEHQVQDGNEEMSVVDMNSVAHAALGAAGQIILTGDDGHAYPVAVSTMLGVHHNVYQTVVANTSQLAGQNSVGTLQVNSSLRKNLPSLIT